MKKCAECHRELDKFSIVCEYCGVLPAKDLKPGRDSGGQSQRPTKTKIAEIEKNLKKGKRG